MVYLAPRRLEVRAQSMFTSSMLVVARTRSASPAPPSRRTEGAAPGPLMHMTSSVSLARWMASSSLSMMVTLWFSRER